MSMVKQRAIAVTLPDTNSQWERESGAIANLWLCAFATDGTKVAVYFPDSVPPVECEECEIDIQETFQGLQRRGTSYETESEYYMSEMGRNPMGGTTDTKEFPTFDAAEQDAIATFQTPLDGADDEEAPDA